MKKSVLILLFIALIMPANAQMGGRRGGNFGGGNQQRPQQARTENSGMQDLIGTEIAALVVMPKVAKADKPNLLKKGLTKDQIRCVDSIDYCQNTDTLSVTLYTHNYAFRSNSVYKIKQNKEALKGSLAFWDIKYLVKKRTVAEDPNTFNQRDFRFTFNLLNLNDERKTKRIVVTKMFNGN